MSKHEYARNKEAGKYREGGNLWVREQAGESTKV